MPPIGLGVQLGLGGGRSSTSSGTSAGGGAGAGFTIELLAIEATITGATHKDDVTGTIAYGTDTNAIYVHKGDGWWDKYTKTG